MATPKKPAHLKQKTGPKPIPESEKVITRSISLHPKKMAIFDREMMRESKAIKKRLGRGEFAFSLVEERISARKKNNK